MWAAPLSQTLCIFPTHHHTYPFSPKTRTRLSIPPKLSRNSPLALSFKAPVTMGTSQSQPSLDQILGSNNWEGLLEPLNLSLRELIIRCGDFCQVTYDSFINDQNSRYCGACRYGMKFLLEKVMLIGASDYEVSAYLYATARVSVPEAFILHSMSRESWDRESNWIGYIAVTTDEVSRARGRREIYVAWRGTTRDYEWADVLGAELESAEELLRPQEGIKNKEGSSSSDSADEDDEKNVKVMRGWFTIYTSGDPRSPFTKASARKQFQSNIKRLMNKYKDEKVSIIVTGHSLGASLAVLSSFDIVENEIVPPDVIVSAIVFGCPEIGNRAFNNQIKQHSNLHILHVRNTIDLIPHYPSMILGYVKTGTELVIDTRKSPDLKDSKDPGDWHNLQAMVHVVSGWNGPNAEFELKVKRSLALVNKSCDFLKDECMVPASWWVEKNKGMMRKADGEWVTESPAEEDRPVPPVLDF